MNSLKARLNRLEKMKTAPLPGRDLDRAREIVERDYRLRLRIYEANLRVGREVGEEPERPDEESIRALALDIITGVYNRQPISIAAAMQEARERRLGKAECDTDGE